jgi:uncharacterized protein YcbK (DUF882 family)
VPAVVNRVRRAGLAMLAVLAGVIGGTCDTQDAVANGDTRSLTFYHNYTKETATITFRRNGQYDQRGLEQLNWMLRDWHVDEPTPMDPRLFDTLWQVYREVGASEPIHINSGYRSPNTNAMLRRRSSRVAKNSQHMRGKAMDFYIPGVSIEKIRAVGMRLQNGGVGFYPNAYTPFVHLDVGSVRAWPRMTRDQLAQIFPDGKTVHIPADGRPFGRYEEAKAEILSRGGSVAGVTIVAQAEGGVAASKPKSFWARLFGLEDEDEDAEEIRTASVNEPYVPRRAPPPNIYSESGSSVYAALQPVAPVASAVRPAPVQEPLQSEAPAPRPVSPVPAPTRIAGLPSTVQTPTGPRLVWQPGPTDDSQSGLPGAGGDVLTQLALAPLPPRRPEDVTETGALAFAPMPPPRPGTPILASSGPAMLSLRGATELASAAPVPLPPPRPNAGPIAVASLARPVIVPSPLPARAIAPGAAKPAQKEKAADEPSQMHALVASSSGTAKRRAMPTGAALLTSPGSGLATGFSAKPLGGLSTNRFSGPAVKPLASH